MARKRPRRQPAPKVIPTQPDADDSPPSTAASPVNVNELLTQAANEVRGLADCMNELDPLVPKPTNPWMAAIPALLEQRGVPSRTCDDILGNERGAALVKSQTAAQVWSAQDHLHAIAVCLPQRTVFSLMSLSRIVMEAACTASWLNTNGTDPAELLQRAITLAYRQIRSATKQADEMSEWHVLSARETEALAEEIASYKTTLAGFDDIGQRFGFNAKEGAPSIATRMAAAMDALRGANPDLELPPDEALLANLHGAVHGDPNTLMGMMDTEVAGGMRTVSVRSRLRPVLWHAVAPTVMMLKTIAHEWETGLQVAEIETHAANLFDVVRDTQIAMA
ncbi:hypothetical protein [Candidatus Poriferisodalis sp.]|uniref:hypothetical protein n=1 Tax=Candidatus Poriferisodalis sp. TaxID=3101277 RepID=UPI003B02694D